jgi:phage-related protein
VFEIIFYKDEKGYSPVRAYLGLVPKRQQDKTIAYLDRLKQVGFGLKRPIADNLGGGLGLYELRPDRNRILYCFHRRTQIILLHAFLKRTDKIPVREIEIALKRKVDYLEREALL